MAGAFVVCSYKERAYFMDLKEFYNKNVATSDYHNRFSDSISSTIQTYNKFNGYEESDYVLFEVFDDEEAITKFKELCQPEASFTYENRIWFYLVTFYLHKREFIVKEFPIVLARPPVEPSDFVYGEIRNRIIAMGKDDNGTVRYATRRILVANLTFERKANYIAINDSINKKFEEISNRGASFTNMSTDEKLAEIANLIESFLKKDGKFLELKYSDVCFNFITDSDVKGYRKTMHCFRHATEEAMIERESFTKEQKYFLINYGLIILNTIHTLLGNEEKKSD